MASGYTIYEVGIWIIVASKVDDWLALKFHPPKKQISAKEKKSSFEYKQIGTVSIYDPFISQVDHQK